MTDSPSPSVRQEETNVPAHSANGELRAMAAGVSIGATGLAPKSLAELMDFAQLMAKGGPMIGKAFRGQPGACLAITMQAMRWGMDPFAVSQKAYVANESIAYEAQLVNAVVLARAPLKGRPTYLFEGEGEKRRCKVIALLKGDPEPKDYLSPPLAAIKAKSPLWKDDPDQQLAYYAIRSWARRHCPEIIMGVYTVEEVQSIEGEVTRTEDYSQLEPDVSPIPDERPFLGGRGKGKLKKELVAQLEKDFERAETVEELENVYNAFKTEWRVSELTEWGNDELFERHRLRIVEAETLAEAEAEIDAKFRATIT